MESAETQICVDRPSVHDRKKITTLLGGVGGSRCPNTWSKLRGRSPESDPEHFFREFLTSGAAWKDPNVQTNAGNVRFSTLQIKAFKHAALHRWGCASAEEDLSVHRGL